MRNVRIVVIMKFLREMAFSAPIFNLFFASRGLSVGDLAIYFTTFRMTQTALEVPMGVLADRFGRRRAIRLSRLAVIISFIIMILADSLLMFLIAAILDGVCNALYSNADTAIVYDELQEQGKTKSFARFIAIYNGLGWLSYSIAAIIGAMIAEQSMVMTLVIRLPVFIVHFAVAGMLKDKRSEPNSKRASTAAFKESWSKITRNRHIMRIIYFSSVIFAFNLIVWNYYQSYGMEIGLPIIMFGWVAVAFSFAEGVPQFLSHKFINPKHFSKLYLILITASAAFGVGSAIFQDGVGFVMLIISVIITGFSFPISSAIIQRHAGNKYRTTVSSFGTLFCMLTYAIINLLFGFVADQFNIFMAFLLVSLLALIAAITYAFVHYARPRLSRYHWIFSDIIHPMLEEGDMDGEAELEPNEPEKRRHVNQGKWSHH
jgi:MFS family permease